MQKPKLATSQPIATSPYLNAPSGTEQDRRIEHLMRLTAAARAKGQTIASIRIPDLEALILIAARAAGMVRS